MKNPSRQYWSDTMSVESFVFPTTEERADEIHDYLSNVTCAEASEPGNRPVIFANPKSRTLAWPRLVTKILAGLISRWVIPSECAASRASVISIEKALPVNCGVDSS